MIKNLAKVLNIKRLPQNINFTYSIKFNGKRLTIPVIYGLGLSNLTIRKDWILNLFKMMNFSEEEVLLDVGVNVGQSLVAFKSCYNNNYYSFVPNANCLYYLKHLVKRNNFNNVKIIPIRLSNENRLVKFYSKTDSDSAATIVENLKPNFYLEDSASYILVLRFDDLNVLNEKFIGLLKIDLEGLELEVLQGMKNMLELNKPIILCEILDCHDKSSAGNTQKRANQVMNLLKKLDYVVFKVVTDGVKVRFEKNQIITLKQWSASGSINSSDYLFVHSRSARMPIFNP